ncbi:hypothetical protein DQ04_12951000 [Trypanosoma grayi]|uniref:hypothetical protein n=1 Tax=Trypanosoma grayi TaxID=71804 RepID=UPI0004F48861|nr:hypothetical protein DQ04_12951000 [Trypanosoma grayi]KEG06644.1 hypothetical protein DQ04_12951000 [Trypanosoma grayi]
MGSASSCHCCNNRDGEMCKQKQPQSAGCEASGADECAWRERLLEEVGKDPVAVTRDFPRTPVYIATATRNNYRDSWQQIEVLVVGDAAARQQWLATRNQRVHESLGLLMELCGEDTAAMDAAWGKAEEEVEIADGSSLLLAVLLESGMMRVKKSGRRGSTDDGPPPSPPAATNGPPNYGTAISPTARETVQYTVHSKALRLMQYMVQSVVFFSVQWMTGVLQFPWCQHLQDIAWTVHVYAEDANHRHCNDNNNKSDSSGSGDTYGGDDTVLVVQHRQTLRHYVDAKGRRVKPRFEVEWTCSVRINLCHLLRGDATAPPTLATASSSSDAEVRSIDTEVLAARVELPQKTACWVSKIWRQRHDELALRLRERLHTTLDKVAVLQERTTH